MKSPKIRPRKGPEAKIQEALIEFLTLRGWFVMETHGNLYQMGFADLFICKRSEGSRWVEVKNLEKYEFTGAQLECFPRFMAEGVGVWILTAATEEEYKKLWQPANWYLFLPVMK